MPTILLVEDDLAINHVLEEHLTDSGFSVIAEADTLAALAKIGGETVIDLLVVDLVMPVGQPNGLSFATMVQERAPGLPVIFITGYYGFVARAGELPGAVLYKPIDLDVLTREINARLVE